MLQDLDSAEGIISATRQLLEQADAYGRLPTPVADIVAAAQLVEPQESLLSDSVIGRAPAHLRAAMARLKSKTRALLDRKAREIHLDPGVEHPGQRKFKRLHEVTHDILPWQSGLAYADDDSTLCWKTRILFEREANQGAAELFFQRELFSQIAGDYKIGTGAILELSEMFGPSKHATFRRYVETHRGLLAGVVLEVNPRCREPLSYRRKETFHSAAWARRLDLPGRWPSILREKPYSFVAHVEDALLAPKRLEMQWPDLNNALTRLNVELFSNSYHVFVLVWLPQQERFKHRRVVVARGT